VTQSVFGRRALRAARGDVPFLLVIAVMVAGFAYLHLNPQHWLRGVLIIGADLIVAGLLRLVLTPRRAGILAVRSRAFDVICYVALGVLVITFGLALPS
jgi:predicted neutral ceramidase superfamily lipid hydrolase